MMMVVVIPQVILYPLAIVVHMTQHTHPLFQSSMMAETTHTCTRFGRLIVHDETNNNPARRRV